MSYAMVCQIHKAHNDDCPACRNFDQAIKKELAGYSTPPEQHVSVTGPKTRTWMKGVFGS